MASAHCDGGNHTSDSRVIMVEYRSNAKVVFRLAALVRRPRATELVFDTMKPKEVRHLGVDVLRAPFSSPGLKNLSLRWERHLQ
jgi:hypothetical protein